MVIAVGVVAWALILTAVVFLGAIVLGRWLQRKGRELERNRD